MTDINRANRVGVRTGAVAFTVAAFGVFLVVLIVFFTVFFIGVRIRARR